MLYRNGAWEVTSTEGAAEAVATKKVFTTGQHIPASGIYLVKHDQHRVPNEVTLLRGQRFPRCGQCGDRVLFELLIEAPDIFADPDFRMVLYELPELPEIEELDRRKVS